MGRLCAQRLARNAHHVWLGWLRADSCDAGDRVLALVWPWRNSSPLAVRCDDLAGPCGLSAPRAVRFSLSDLLDLRAFSAALRGAVLPVEKYMKVFPARKAGSLCFGCRVAGPVFGVVADVTGIFRG